MRIRNKGFFWLPALLAALLMFLCMLRGLAEPETPLNSPSGRAMLSLTGDFALSDAEMDLCLAECLRVDAVYADETGAWMELRLPLIPQGLRDVLLFDGWHLFHGEWRQTDGQTLRAHFSADDLKRLDGTVGLYLVLLAVR